MKCAECEKEIQEAKDIGHLGFYDNRLLCKECCEEQTRPTKGDTNEKGSREYDWRF